MDGRKITWTQSAVKQRNFIFKYWNEKNKSKNYSRKLNLLIKGRLRLLKEFPELGKQTNREKLRLLVVLHYKLFYRIEVKGIIVVGIWDSRRNPQEISAFLKSM